MNGPIVQFLNNLDVTVMNKPVDYNARTMQKVARRYQRLARQINRHRTNDLKHQTVIFNLSESFADPRRIPGIKVTIFLFLYFFFSSSLMITIPYPTCML